MIAILSSRQAHSINHCKLSKHYLLREANQTLLTGITVALDSCNVAIELFYLANMPIPTDPDDFM